MFIFIFTFAAKKQTQETQSIISNFELLIHPLPPSARDVLNFGSFFQYPVSIALTNPYIRIAHQLLNENPCDK